LQNLHRCAAFSATTIVVYFYHVNLAFRNKFSLETF